LNEDLAEICNKVSDIRGKIVDKKSKYWISIDNNEEMNNYLKGK